VVLPFLCISTQSPPQARHLFCNGKSFFVPFQTQDHGLCYQPLCHICTHLSIIFKYEAAKMLLQRQKMMAVRNVIYKNVKQK